MLTDDAVLDALDGFQAWSVGATDSGINDPDLERRVRDYLRALPKQQRLRLLMRLMDERLTGPNRTPEDLEEFGHWWHEWWGRE